jgi:hypothetical protein
MIATRTEIKNILGITAATYDSAIDTLIPYVQDDIVEHLHNLFPDKNTRYNSGNFIMVNNSTSPDQITDTTNQRFSIEGFAAGMDIAVEGTYRNRGIYAIDVATSETLTLSSEDSLLTEKSTDEYGGNNIRITRCDWPKGLKLYVAQIIWENISRALNKGIKSKSLGPSSITYESIEMGGYSSHIIKGLAKYRKAVVK